MGNEQSMPVLVDVAVPFPIYGTFTYALPDNLKPVRSGSRLLVPFGSRKLVGILVGSASEAPAGAETKSVIRVLDAEPLLSPDLVRLGLWIASYYFSPPGEAFRVMLPPGVMLKKVSGKHSERLWPVRRQWAVVEAASDPPPQATKRQREALCWLAGRRMPVLLSDFTRDSGIGPGVIRRLEEGGSLRLEEIELERSPWDLQEAAWRPASRPLRRQLTVEQQGAFGRIQQALDKGGFGSLLLHGVTGSGKTEVYLRSIEYALKLGKSALLLVPEIGLTPQTAQAFRSWFGEEVAILHSGLSSGERFDQWRRIQGRRSQIVVGTRSAVFAPVTNLGIVILDEEHDSSYKQDEFPRYHARETALQRCRMENALVVLGSATPQLETFHLAQTGKHACLVMSKRIEERPLPTVTVIDMREEFRRRGPGIIVAEALREALRKRLENREQALVLINRRGYAPFLLCRSCGNFEMCENCSISLTFHRRYQRLICHYCGYSRLAPKECAQCGKEYVQYVGEGTERIQEYLQELFPDAVIDRLDRDATRPRGAYDRILGGFSRGQTDILVGTQMIAKGHHFPQVTLVGVLAADQGLKLPDFRSAERTFQLLTQVAGRAGRGDLPGEVFLQSYFPRHYSLEAARDQDYEAFFAREIDFRRRFRYPPFTILANLMVHARERSKGLEEARQIARRLTSFRDRFSSEQRMRILGPAPAVLERIKGEYRFQILVKTVSRRELHQVLTETVKDPKAVGFSLRRLKIDVDPMSLL